MHLLDYVFSEAAIEAPLSAVDLSTWAFGLTSEEFRACSPEHLASSQVCLPDGTRIFIAVETIASNFAIHHFLEEIAERGHLRAFSGHSRLWAGGRYQTSVNVTWELKAVPQSTASCQLLSEVVVKTDDAILAERRRNRPRGREDLLEEHCREEAQKFAADIGKKACQGLFA